MPLAAGHPQGCKCSLSALPHATPVPEMQKTGALCMTLPIEFGEQEELLLQLLAAKDATGAPSPDEPALKLTLEDIGAYAPSEEDFS
ncbi:hypothetical protein C0989_008479 [Termitomyces sp. Mn162]|nr:hypothetical protein C0989_008479 [Termitomyces sp. Mn162]